MARPDGRIEKGQRLATAISARAWNRAQEAADRVLGAAPGVEAGTGVTDGNTIVVRIAQGWPTLDHTPLAVGHGISLPLRSLQNATMLTAATNVQGAGTALTVQNENDLPQYVPSDTACITVQSSDTAVSLSSRCGIIETVSALEDGYYTCLVRVRGLVRCRVLLLAGGTAVSPPPPYPSNATLRNYWRRYLMATEYGTSSIVGIGAIYKLNSPNSFPAIAEAVVELG
jgi:hypothetical protein